MRSWKWAWSAFAATFLVQSHQLQSQQALPWYRPDSGALGAGRGQPSTGGNQSYP
jgi:hypothetical protein